MRNFPCYSAIYGKPSTYTFDRSARIQRSRSSRAVVQYAMTGDAKPIPAAMREGYFAYRETQLLSLPGLSPRPRQRAVLCVRRTLLGVNVKLADVSDCYRNVDCSDHA